MVLVHSPETLGTLIHGAVIHNRSRVPRNEFAVEMERIYEGRDVLLLLSMFWEDAVQSHSFISVTLLY